MKFEGSVKKCVKCVEGVPHYPEVSGHYNTVANSWGQIFCLGLPGEGVQFQMERSRGDEVNFATLRWEPDYEDILARKEAGENIDLPPGYTYAHEGSWGYCGLCGHQGRDVIVHDPAGRLVRRFPYPGPHVCVRG